MKTARGERVAPYDSTSAVEALSRLIVDFADGRTMTPCVNFDGCKVAVARQHDGNNLMILELPDHGSGKTSFAFPRVTVIPCDDGSERVVLRSYAHTVEQPDLAEPVQAYAEDLREAFEAQREV